MQGTFGVELLRDRVDLEMFRFGIDQDQVGPKIQRCYECFRTITFPPDDVLAARRQRRTDECGQARFMVDEEDAFWFAHVVDESPGWQKQPICQGPALRAGPRMLSFSLAIMSQQVKKTAPATNFEQAMKRLEEIVEQMESGELPLEDLIVRYEEGMKLVKVCQERLASAEHRIEIITRNNAGKPVVKEFETPAAPAPAASPEPKGEPKNVDVSLF